MITFQSHKVLNAPRQYYVTYRALSSNIGRIHPLRRRKANQSLTPFSSNYMSFTIEVPYTPHIDRLDTMTSHKDPLVWIDCEVTSLDISRREE